MSEEVKQAAGDLAYWQRRAEQAEARARIASETYDGQQQSYRELEALYQASQQRALAAEARVAALMSAITPLLGAWGSEDSYDDETEALFDVVESLDDAGAELLAELEQLRAGHAKAWAEVAALREPKTQLTNVFDALTGLINEWNDAAEDGDRGRDNKMLVLTLWDDGSGRLGTAHGYEQDTGTFCDVSMNIQEGWNDTDGLVSFLLELVNARSFGGGQG